jgi:RNA polymerase sigma-70 factor, ECF subfamily
MRATAHGDASAMVRLLRADAFCAMPPSPESYVGAEAIVAAWVEGGFGSAEFGEFRCVATRANSQPAVACYLRRPGDSAYRPLVLDVLRIEGGAVAEVTVFPLEPLLDALGLPAKL